MAKTARRQQAVPRLYKFAANLQGSRTKLFGYIGLTPVDADTQKRYATAVKRSRRTRSTRTT